MNGRILPASLAAALALCAVAELAAGPGAPPAAPGVLVPVLAAPATFKAVFAPRWAATILARPLFRPDRRPLPKIATTLDATVPRLSAIIVTGSGRDAVFATADGSAVAVELGGRIGAFEVGGMTADTVSLIGPDGIVTIHPQYTGLNGADGAP